MARGKATPEDIFAFLNKATKLYQQGQNLYEEAKETFGNGPEKQHWTRVLGVEKRDGLPAAEKAYRELMQQAHPDKGGSEDDAILINQAIAEARAFFDTL